MHSMLDTCKGGRQELVYYGMIVNHRDRDEDDRLVSRDVRGRWVAGGNSRRATEITPGLRDLVLC